MSEAADQQKPTHNDEKGKDKKTDGLPKEEELVSIQWCMQPQLTHDLERGRPIAEGEAGITRRETG